MVTYSYENLFTEHFAADFLIVDINATVTINAGIMPTVSGEAFKIDNNLLKSESIKLQESLCSEKNLKFGKIEASKLTFSFKNDASIPTDLTTEEIDVYLFFNYNSTTLFKVGRYTIDSDKYSDNNYVRTITAYDINYYLKNQDVSSWYYRYFGDGQKHMIGLTILNLFNWLRDPNDEYDDSPKINVQIESGYNLCNGTFLLGKTIESDEITFEYFMQRLLEFNGAFGHINRQGKFEFVTMEWYDAEPVRIITNDDRIPPTEHDIVSTWGIGGIDVYDGDNIRRFKIRNTNKKHPSVYKIVDSFVLADRKKGDSDTKEALKKLHNVIHHLNYKSCNVSSTGDLCVEVGDRININVLPDEGESRGWFRSYALERTFSGIQGMTDIYRSKGDKKQPKYEINTNTAHSGDSDLGTDGSDGVSFIDDDHDQHFCEIIRNIGKIVLDEPSDVECVYDDGDMEVKLKWTDPDDITSAVPKDATWAGTVVVRKEGSPPRHRWDDCTLIVNSTTRDAYKNTYLIDNTIEEDKQYYYGIFPYHIKNGEEWYRFTKKISVNTSKFIDAPTILSAVPLVPNTEQNNRSVTRAAEESVENATGETENTRAAEEETVENYGARVTYYIPALASGSYEYAKLLYKQGRIPKSVEDGTAVDLDTFGTNKTIDITGLTEGASYWFIIYTDRSESDPVQMGENTGGVFFSVDLTTDGRDTVRYNADKTIGVHKQGELYNNSGSPGYTISDGVLDVTSVSGNKDITWAYDSTENPGTIPKDCTLTFEYDAYFPNGEGYLDWYIYNSDNVESVYWCFDTKHEFQADKWYNCKTVCKVVNGVITRCKYVLDGTEVAVETPNKAMPCTDANGSKGISYIQFNLTKRTKMKSISIYYDFSEYTDHGGSGSGGTSGSSNNSNSNSR